MTKDLIPSVETELFETIGSFGRWQKTIFGILFYTFLVTIWQNYAMTFLAPNVPFKCVPESENSTVLPGECQVLVQRGPNWTETASCTRWEYNSTDRSMVSEWDLVCNREWMISFAKSIYMLGYLVSSLVFGQLSDWVGRYPTMLISLTIACISLLLCLFSNSMTEFLIFRFFLAFGRTGFSTTGFVLIMETMGPRHRTLVSIAVQLAWSAGICTLALIGYLFRDWFWFHVAIALPMLPLIFSLMIIPESPRWLLMHMKLKPLKKFILRATAINKIKLTEDINVLLNRLIQNHESERKGTLLDLFRTPRIRNKTLIMMYLWFVNAFMYYSLSFNTNDLSGDPYLNFLLTGVLEFPSYAILFWAINRFGRRMTLLGFMILGGAACAALLAVPYDLSRVSTGLALFGKFCVTSSFGLLYLYTGELFPTVVRNSALGSCNTIARIGSTLAPFSKELGIATHDSVPNVITSVLAVSSGLLALWLPETAGRKLPDSLEEGEEKEIVDLCSQKN